MRAPSWNTITLKFDATTDPYSPASPHMGTDFSPSPDNRIYAPFSGRVTQIPNNGRDGNGSYITEPNGRFHGMLHASSYLVENGALVTEGQAIAVMGWSGYVVPANEKGTHLHWCVKENNKFIDPMSLIGENMPTISQEEYDDLKHWKEVGIDALPYKEQIIKTKAWASAADMSFVVDRIAASVDDLYAYKYAPTTGYEVVSEQLYRKKT